MLFLRPDSTDVMFLQFQTKVMLLIRPEQPREQDSSPRKTRCCFFIQNNKILRHTHAHCEYFRRLWSSGYTVVRRLWIIVDSCGNAGTRAGNLGMSAY